MSSTDRVTKNKFVQFNYFITDDNDEIIERVELPLNCVFGRHNRLYDKVELALLGAQVGEEVSVELEPSEAAWGEIDPNQVVVEDINKIPPEYRHIGAEIEFRNEQGDVKNFQVTSINQGKITIDGNHPYAGHKVNFHVTILTIRDATEQELSEGVSAEPGGLEVTQLH